MCVSPIKVHIKPSHADSCIVSKERDCLVPCGHCIECLKDKQNSWFVRLWSEFQGQQCLFFTLTYSPKSVSFNVSTETGEIFNTVCQKHIQDTLKRFRINYERSHGHKLDFKYFICSEYGPRSLRPHYHGIVNLSPALFMPFLEDWRKRFGFVNFSVVRNLTSSLHYVTKYALKGNFDNPLIKQGLVKKNFRLVSKKLGYDWIKSHVYVYLHQYIKNKKVNSHVYSNEYLDKIIQTFKVNIQGFNYKLPKYFVEVLFKNKVRLQSAVKKRIQEKYDSFFIRELEQLQTSHSYGTSVQILSLKEKNEFLQKVEFSKDKRLQYLKFLSQSKI